MFAQNLKTITVVDYQHLACSVVHSRFLQIDLPDRLFVAKSKIMSYPASDISDEESDHAMDNIRAMLQDYYGTDQGDEVKEEDYYDMDNKVFDKDKYIPVRAFLWF